MVLVLSTNELKRKLLQVMTTKYKQVHMIRGNTPLFNSVRMAGTLSRSHHHSHLKQQAGPHVLAFTTCTNN